MNATLTNSITTPDGNIFTPWGRYKWEPGVKLAAALRAYVLGCRPWNKQEEFLASAEGVALTASLEARIQAWHLPEDITEWIREAAAKWDRVRVDASIARDHHERNLAAWTWVED